MSNNKNNKNVLDLNKIVQMFYQHQVLIKTLHFQTKYYGAHKALDSHLAEFTLLMDQFMEVAQGTYGTINIKKIHISANTLADTSAKDYLQSFVSALKVSGRSLEQIYKTS